MGECRLCGRKGWLVSVNQYGLCMNCQSAVAVETSSRLRVINESSEIIRNSKNLATRLSRCDVLEENARELRKYEERGLPVTNPLPSQLMALAQQLREEVLSEEAVKILDAARAKADVVATPKARVSALSAGLLKITELCGKIDPTPAKVRESQEALKAEVRRANLEVFLDDARKAEFKGQVNKAIDKYKEALYFLKTDVVDDRLQDKDIAEIEGKIAELGAATRKRDRRDMDGREEKA
ncbi:MAG TPA: hypothetical protein GXX23_02615 [Firmicutes bacterium]|nr:hypothetical protein [Candidatus Fermentithermobacillaceae bacterium]